MRDEVWKAAHDSPQKPGALGLDFETWETTRVRPGNI
jgi:hypothetical protein